MGEVVDEVVGEVVAVDEDKEVGEVGEVSMGMSEEVGVMVWICGEMRERGGMISPARKRV